MTDQTDENRNSSNTIKSMTKIVSEYIDKCIQCHRCMDVCPVTKCSFSINELNQASKDGKQVPPKIKEFAFNCMQCGKCAPVCPVNIRRDYMVRYIKYKIKDQKPWSYKRYLFIKGPDLTGMRGIIQKLYVVLKKITTRDLACFMETTLEKKDEVLFYAGCYIYSKKTVRQTHRLLNHLGCSYSVLGGVTSCCGAPHMLQGEFDQADHCLKLLHEKIKAVDPKIVITACAECYEAVAQIKTTYHEKFEVLSVVQYLQRNSGKFPNIKIRGKILLHDSCRFSKDSPQGAAARDTISAFGQLVEPPSAQGSSCCYQWNHGCDQSNTARRIAYLAEVKNAAPTLACNCLTCYEELKKFRTDVEIIDVLQLFTESLDNAEGKER
jgi:heterodisulfide reductase subunit D